MRKGKIIISTENDPMYNLALEGYLIEESSEDIEILYLWQNSMCIVHGRSQNPWSECKVTEFTNDGGTVVRRASGGGAVYQDLGNICFTILSPASQKSKERNFAIVCDALKQLGLQGEVSGRNDLMVNSKKISGSAFQITSQRFCHHGTMLINANLANAAKYLTPHSKKLESKGIKSVASRIANLTDFDSSIDKDSFNKAIITAFENVFEIEENPKYVGKEMLAEHLKLREKFEMFSSLDWRLGKTPEFTHKTEFKNEFGLFSVHLLVQQGIITDAKVFSDSLDPDSVDKISPLLIGKSYSKSGVKSIVSDDKLVHQVILDLADLI